MKKVSQYCLALIIVLCISVSIRAMIEYVETLSGALIPVQAENTVVYTPNGSSVPAAIYSEGMTAARMAEDLNVINLLYNGVQIVGDATTTYNCHGYAWNMSEGGDPCWILSSSVGNYWLDYSYVETTSEHAQKIIYGIGAAHSAVKSTGGKYISKWGASFLIKHNPTDTPYGSDLRYYAKPPEISGHPIVSNSVSSTFTLALLH